MSAAFCNTSSRLSQVSIAFDRESLLHLKADRWHDTEHKFGFTHLGVSHINDITTCHKLPVSVVPNNKISPTSILRCSHCLTQRVTSKMFGFTVSSNYTTILTHKFHIIPPNSVTDSAITVDTTLRNGFARFSISLYRSDHS